MAVNRPNEILTADVITQQRQLDILNPDPLGVWPSSPTSAAGSPQPLPQVFDPTLYAGSPDASDVRIGPEPQPYQFGSFTDPGPQPGPQPRLASPAPPPPPPKTNPLVPIGVGLAVFTVLRYIL